MTGADAGAVVAVEVFVKRNQVAPVGIALEFFRAPEDRTTPGLVARENPREPLRDLAGDFPERHHLARTGRALHLEALSQVKVGLLQ